MEKEEMPVKLQIAKDFMAAHISGCARDKYPYDSQEMAASAIKDAEALLNAYNNSKAAAPELLEALKVISDCFWSEGESYEYRVEDLKRIAAEAVKKATT